MKEGVKLLFLLLLLSLYTTANKRKNGSTYRLLNPSLPLDFDEYRLSCRSLKPLAGMPIRGNSNISTRLLEKPNGQEAINRIIEEVKKHSEKSNYLYKLW